jgi:hypothetical protein
MRQLLGLGGNPVVTAPCQADQVPFSREGSASGSLDTFEPGFVDKMLDRAERKREELSRAVEEAGKVDERDYQEALSAYWPEHSGWESGRELAERILSGDTDAYLDAVRQNQEALTKIGEIGLSMAFRPENSSLIVATLQTRGEDFIPSETKRLLKSGQLSVKRMPKTRFYELYQDYICGCVLRVAREVLALLPVQMVIVNALGSLLNTQTGYVEEQPILSVAIPRSTVERLNFNMLDTSDAMKNFVHRMKFMKTKGFEAIETLRPSDLQAP